MTEKQESFLINPTIYKKPLKETGKAKATLVLINKYIEYYLSAKRHLPERVVATQKQLDSLGVDNGYLYSRVRLELK